MRTDLPLTGIRVLDLTRNVAGPHATMILADLGATVTKVEHPERGDDTRHWGPPFVAQESAQFLALNRNKESITLDLSVPEAREIMDRLVQQSDVLLESFRPGALADLGYGPDWGLSRNPALIYCSITGYGHTGPLQDRPGYDPLIQAYAGLMSITGEAGRPPVRVGFSVIDMGTGLWSALAVLAALYRRRDTGQGEHIVTSLYETALSWATLPLATYWAGGGVPEPFGSGTSTIVPYRAFPTRDGYLVIGAANDRLFQRLCGALGHPEWSADPRYRHNPDRVRRREEVDALIAGATAQLPQAELAARLAEAGVPCSPVRNLEEVAADEHVAALGTFQRPREDGPFSDLPLVALPLVTGGVRPPIRTAAPRLGQHNAALLARLGYSDAEIQRLIRSPAMRGGAGDES